VTISPARLRGADRGRNLEQISCPMSNPITAIAPRAGTGERRSGAVRALKASKIFISGAERPK
jgi:hypothetical protein